MVLLMESLHFIKMGFNDRFLALRDLKRRIIDNINKVTPFCDYVYSFFVTQPFFLPYRQDNSRLVEIDRILGDQMALFQPKHNPSEWPERRDIVSDEELNEFQKERAAAQQAAQVKSRTSFFSPGGHDDTSSKQESGNAPSAAESTQQPSASASSIKSEASHAPAAESGGFFAPTAGLSVLEQYEQKRDRLLLMFERKTLTSKIEQTVATFDQAVSDLR